MFSYLVIYFTVYSVFAWVVQSVASSVSLRGLHFHNYFLGPYSFTYGFITMILITIDHFWPMNMLLTGIAGFFIALIFDFSVNFLMEKFFKIQWWDYSNKKYNFNSRVNLANIAVIAFSGIIICEWIQPWLESLITDLPIQYIRPVSSLILGILIIDFFISTSMVFIISEKLRDIKRFADALGKELSLSEIYELSKNNTTAGMIIDILDSTHNVTLHFVKRMVNAKYVNFGELTHAMDLLRTYSRYVDYRTRNAYLKKKYEVATGIKSFASGINLYKLFWMFVFGCIFGYFWELLYCLVKNGYLESRQGMIYGPFSQIYGFGAILMTFLLVRFSKKKGIVIFIIGAFIGGLFEAAASLIQELVFSTSSWHYPPELIPMFGGRTCLVYMIFWGFLAYFFVRVIYPTVSRFIEKIPNKQGIIISWVLLAFLLFDAAISGVAVYRWEERSRDIPPSNAIYEFVDRHYPNSIMRDIYPHMKVVEK